MVGTINVLTNGDISTDAAGKVVLLDIQHKSHVLTSNLPDS